MDGTFVGRARVQAAFDALVDRARQGRPQPLALVGAAGLGKTALLDHLVARATRSGFRSVVVRADRADGDVPFAALRLALDGVLPTERDPSLAELATTLHGWLGRPPGPAPHRSPRRDEVLDALRAVLEGWAFHGPVLVAVDDLHVADPATAAAVLFLLRHLRRHRVLVVVTTRGEPYLCGALAADLDRFERAGTLDVVRLGPLDPSELAILVERRLGTPPSPALARMLGERSGGVPVFAVELLDALAAGGAVRVEVGGPDGALDEAVLPRRVSTAVLHRVFQLGADARAVATAAAALGRVPLGDLRLAADLARLDLRRVEAAFDALVRAEVLVPDDGGFRFAHTIVRDAVHDDLGPAARRRLHGEIAAALIEGTAVERSAGVVEVAEHLRQAGGGPDPAAAAHLAAAGDALRHVTPRTAATWYREALVRLDPQAPAATRLALRLSGALDLAHAHGEAAAVAREALASATGADRRRAREAAARALLAAGRIEEAGALLDAGPVVEPGGRDPAAPGMPIEAGRAGKVGTALLRAQVHLVAGRPAAAARWLAAAPRTRPGDRLAAAALELQLSGAAGDHAAEAARARDLRACLDREDGEWLPGGVAARLALCGASAFDLDPAGALAEADVTGGGPLHGWFQALGAWAAYRRGDWDDALRRAGVAGAAVDLAGSLVAGLVVAVRLAVLAERGGVAEAEAAERDAGVSPLPAFRSELDVAVALLRRAQGRHGEAAALLGAAGRREREEGRRNVLGMVLAHQVEAAVERGDLAAARAAADELWSLPSCDAAVALTMRRLLARASAHGDADAAGAARAHGERHGLAVDAAQASGVLGALRADGDLLAEAYLALGRLGAAVRQRPVARALRRLGRRIPADRRRGDGLRPVEIDIVGLVAAGLSNRQIGQRTGLSPKTIEVYLSRIYAKTGHRSRVELAVASRDGQLTGLRSVTSHPDGAGLRGCEPPAATQSTAISEPWTSRA